MPLHITINKQQLTFWKSMQSLIADHPRHHIKRLIDLGNETRYINYFKELDDRYGGDPEACINTLTTEFREDMMDQIRRKFGEDEDSRLGTYYIVNPDLCKPEFKDEIEYQRILKTRYRTGSHNLMIEKGRIYSQLDRDERLCKCQTEIQNLKHVMLSCPLLNDIRTKYSVIDIHSGINNVDYILEMEKILEIK